MGIIFSYIREWREERNRYIITDSDWDTIINSFTEEEIRKEREHILLDDIR